MLGLLCVRNFQLTVRRAIQLSSGHMAGGKWRTSRGEGPCGNEYGPLVDIPDWTYADGRPAPLSPSELDRREKYGQLGERAMDLMDQLEMAKVKYKNKQKEEQQYRNQLRQHKIRPKPQKS